MLSIQVFLTCQSKLPMNYKHPSQAERYQIHALTKAGHNQSEIAKVLECNKSSISCELVLNRRAKGYRPKQACEPLPLEKILLLTPLVLGDDYQPDRVLLKT